MQETRQNKIARLLQKELSVIFQEQTRAMRGVMVSVTRVRISPDLSVCTAYLSIFPSERAQELIANIEARGPKDFVAYDTVCNRVAGRARQLEDFARSVDVLLFAAGANSSNGHYLYEYCRKVQPRTHLIGSAAEVRAEWLEGAARVGVSGATSTPRWLMEDIKQSISR